MSLTDSTADIESTRQPLPDNAAVSGVSVGVVCIGITISLPVLYTGGELAQGLGFTKGLLAIVVGALVLSVMSVPAAIVGSRTRLTSYMIVEHVFGRVGAKLINLVLGLVLLGWYAVTAEFFGRTLFIAAAENNFTAITEQGWIVITSIGVVVTSIYGYRAIDRLARVAVPALLLFLLWIVYLALQHSSVAELLAAPVGEMSFTEGVSVVIGAMIVNVVLMPDLTRYAKGDRDSIIASFLGNGGGSIVSAGIAIIPALALGVLDPMKYMIALGAFALSVGVLVFATWTTNGVNLYSTGLVAGSALPGLSYRWLIVIAGVLGTLVALVGIADHLVSFLITLGLIVPPVAGVYLSRYFLLGERDFSAQHLDRRDWIAWPELLACLLAGGISVVMWQAEISFTGVSAVESLILSVVLYLGLKKLGAVLSAQPV